MEEVLREGWDLSLSSLGVPIWDEIYPSKMLISTSGSFLHLTEMFLSVICFHYFPKPRIILLYYHSPEVVKSRIKVTMLQWGGKQEDEVIFFFFFSSWNKKNKEIPHPQRIIQLICSHGQTPPFQKCIREEILGFLVSPSGTCAQLWAIPSCRDRAQLFQEHRAHPHPQHLACAAIPLPKGCRSSSGLRPSSDRGTERKSKRGTTPLVPSKPFLFHSAAPGKGNKSSESSEQLPTRNSTAPSLLHPSKLKGKLGRGSVQVPQCPHRQLGASPACSSQGASCWHCHPCQDTRECQESLFSSGKKHSNSLCFLK